MNWIGVKAIYIHEMDRMRRTTIQSIFAPVISASLYFVVFGSAIGSRIPMIQDVSYGSFIVPGMMMLALLTQSVSNASSGIFFPKFLGTINEIYAAPLSTTEIIIGFVGAATTKSIILGTLILGTALFFVEVKIMHPFVMILMLVLTSLTFSLLGFLIGVLSKNWEELSLFPTIILAPMVFLGGSLYSIKWIPEFWQTVSLINPVLYLVSGFRWSFYELADVSITISLFAIFTFLFLNIIALAYIFKKGYRIKF
jgi:ABC-2 type transport system permease protein